MPHVENTLLRRPQAMAPAGWSGWMGTLARELRVTGRGLHTGRRISVRILPVDAEQQYQGIVFRRVRAGRVIGELPARPECWCKQPLCSTLRAENGMMVRTTEHLLAALLLCEIDAATVELDAEEVPILDGSAAMWCRLIAQCGRSLLPSRKRFIKVLRPLTVPFPDEPAYRLSPAKGYWLKTDIQPDDFPTDSWQGPITPKSFRADLAPARSYGHLRKALPAILGGYAIGTPILRGAIFTPLAVIARGRVLGGMRLPSEFARHRALDLIGDFALAGAPLLANVQVSKPVHERNNAVIRRLLAEKDKWVWVEFGDA